MIQGGLFTRDFLEQGIVEDAVWAAQDVAELRRLHGVAAGLFAKVTGTRNPTEAVTEEDLIYPLLSAIGWNDLKIVQPNASKKGRDDVPDALLFSDEEAVNRARREPDSWKQFRHGACLVEAKRWNRALGREEKGRRGEAGVPETQMLRYLRRADDVTDGRLRWGILTNGRLWRLYFQGALSVSEDFLEIDLGKVFDLPGCAPDLLDTLPEGFPSLADWRRHVFRLFVLMFGRAAFLPQRAGLTFHEVALQDGKQWEARVARDLSNKVFDEVFPDLANGIAAKDPLADRALGGAYLNEVRQGALILLYRLLFVLYAEDRNLLPDETGAYADYCLTRMRQEIAAKKAEGRTFPGSFETYWPKLKSIFRAIAEGDDDLGIPPYNGGLFDPTAARILERASLSDAVLADVIFRLSHQEDAKSRRGPKYINYRDLSVQQLGSVYERILEHGLTRGDDGRIAIKADESARKGSGSYYTPEELVGLIIERAVRPLVTERVEAFHDRAEMLTHDRRPVIDRIEEACRLDPAERLLDLKICDPAMGSGHFLVSLVDWLTDEVLTAMDEARNFVTFGAYVSPLAGRIASIRDKILAEARAHRWPIVEAQLDDRHIVRRMVLKRVVYGVDLNPMAVELAKVALWLHSFTVGAPLSFLDHHLRCGNSVVGAWTAPTARELEAHGVLLNPGMVTRVEQVAKIMGEIEETTDNDIGEVAVSKSKFEIVADATRPVEAFYSLLTAERMMQVFESAPKREPLALEKMGGKTDRQLSRWRADWKAFDRAASFETVLDGGFGDPIRIATGEARIAPPEVLRQFRLLQEDKDAPAKAAGLFPDMRQDDRRRALADDLVNEARALAQTHRFFHWEIGFPNVWSNLLSNQPAGGFDAVIGNPPYVRQELLGDLKPALKSAYAAFDGMADLYVYFYEQGLRLLKPGGRMSYVVTNKWLKAGYAEPLRELFTDPDRAVLEFVADFGHAKHFFPDADVFPSVITVRKPDGGPAGADAQICVIPRDAVPEKGLQAAVTEASYPLPLAAFTKESWTLEPPAVMALLDKIRRNGVPLAELIGRKPVNGIKTGLNEAYLINRGSRETLVRDDPNCSDIIKPYLRGQDVERWVAPKTDLFMITIKSSSDHKWPWSEAPDDLEAEQIFKLTYPSLFRHAKLWEEWIDPESGKKKGLRYREDQGRFWWELRSCAYYDLFSRPRIAYQAIQFYPQYAIEKNERLGNNKTYFIPTDNDFIAACLNSPVGWYYSWRHFLHMKDEALSNDQVKIVDFPVARADFVCEPKATDLIGRMLPAKIAVTSAGRQIGDWLHHEFGLDKPGRTLAEPHRLDADGFIAAVKSALPKRQKLSAADIARLRQEWTDTIVPARVAAGEVLALERKLSDLVNDAYGLTPEEVKLMWETAPPRMPLDPADELRRLGYR